MASRNVPKKWWLWGHASMRETARENRKIACDRHMAHRHGNILVRCPACGKLSLVPNTGRKRWKCSCTPSQSRFVQEDALPDRLQQLGDSAFYSCGHLDKVEIPPKLLVGLQLGSPLIEVSYEEMKRRAEDEGIKVTSRNAFQLADQEVCRRLEQLLAQKGPQ